MGVEYSGPIYFCEDCRVIMKQEYCENCNQRLDEIGWMKSNEEM